MRKRSFITLVGAVVLILGLSISMMQCAPSGEEVTPPPEEVVTPPPEEVTPSPEEAPTEEEPAIPPDFVTYTDEAELFSISYPPYWETDLSTIPELEKSSKDLMESMQFDIPLEGVRTIFLGGLSRKGGWLISINVVVEPVGFSTVDDYYEQGRQYKELVLEDYELFEQVKTVVGGKEAIIDDSAFDLPGIPQRFRAIQMVILTGKIGWCVVCGTAEEEFDANKDTIEQVVRSLRILS